MGSLFFIFRSHFVNYGSLLSIWSILTKRRQLVFSGGLHQTNATITSFVERCCAREISTVVEPNDNTHDYKTNDRKNN